MVKHQSSKCFTNVLISFLQQSLLKGLTKITSKDVIQILFTCENNNLLGKNDTIIYCIFPLLKWCKFPDVCRWLTGLKSCIRIISHKNILFIFSKFQYRISAYVFGIFFCNLNIFFAVFLPWFMSRYYLQTSSYNLHMFECYTWKLINSKHLALWELCFLCNLFQYCKVFVAAKYFTIFDVLFSTPKANTTNNLGNRCLKSISVC